MQALLAQIRHKKNATQNNFLAQISNRAKGLFCKKVSDTKTKAKTKNAKTKSINTHQMIQLYNANAYEAIKSIPDNSVDLIITDPPYAMQDYGKGKKKSNLF